MSYCRKHHYDLVHISNHAVQQQVAQVGKNATSAHIWIGLRYTCNFNFWFWTSSASACYLNWAPGQGSDSEYGCGVAGAVEATGGQQWVGLPETEALNFICATCAGWAQQAAGVQCRRAFWDAFSPQRSPFHLCFLTLRHADIGKTATAKPPRFRPELTRDIIGRALLEYSCWPPLLALNFIRPRKPYVACRRARSQPWAARVMRTLIRSTLFTHGLPFACWPPGQGPLFFLTLRPPECRPRPDRPLPSLTWPSLAGRRHPQTLTFLSAPLSFKKKKKKSMGT